VFDLSAPVDCEPLVALLPDHPPDAVHAVAFVEVHDNVELSPLEIELGFAVNVTVGEGWLIVTFADCVALPPVPVQVSV
jgi:hypothetical protein